MFITKAPQIRQNSTIITLVSTSTSLSKDFLNLDVLVSNLQLLINAFILKYYKYLLFSFQMRQVIQTPYNIDLNRSIIYNRRVTVMSESLQLY